MKIVFDGNAAYEHFQFLWLALILGKDKAAVEELKKRFIAVSRALPDGIGRVLRKPCVMELSSTERCALVERITEVSERGGWQDHAKPAALAALKFVL